MENNLIACYATDTAGTIFVQIDEETFIVETVDIEGFCWHYARVSSLQDGWTAFDEQKRSIDPTYKGI